MKKEYLIAGGLVLVGLYLYSKKGKQTDNEVSKHKTDSLGMPIVNVKPMDMGANTDGVFGSDIKCTNGKVKKVVGGGVAGGLIYMCVDPIDLNNTDNIPLG